MRRARRARPARTPITMPAIAPPERLLDVGDEVEPGRSIGMMWACGGGFGQVHCEMEKFLRS